MRRLLVGLAIYSSPPCRRAGHKLTISRSHSKSSSNCGSKKQVANWPDSASTWRSTVASCG